MQLTIDVSLAHDPHAAILLDKAGLHVLSSRRTTDVIGTLQWKARERRWRLTRWRRNGPTGHDLFTDEQLSRELHAWTADPAAGERLESWTDTPEWSHGVLQCQFVQCWNACAAAGRYDLGSQLHDHASEHDLQTTIDELVPRIYRELRTCRP